jgi:hypothetical protein
MIRLLIILASLPGILLIAYVYKQDKIEKEPKGLLIKLMLFGVLSIIPAVIAELIGGAILFAIGAVMGGNLTFYSTGCVLNLIYMGFISAGAYTLWGVLLKYNPVSRVSILGFINPVMGVLLSALFQRYIPQEWMVRAFGGNEAWGVLMAATIGVPLYACGGGTIPLLQSWLQEGMSLGSAAAFMITGPATKITNLGALKIVMGWKRFFLYVLFVMFFSLASGLIVNLIL